MSALYLTSVVLHIFAAMLWVGGMGFFALVVVPVVRRTLPIEQGQLALREAGARFSTIGWWALGALFVTGAFNLWFRGGLSQMTSAAFWATPFGSTLALKLGVILVMLTLSVAHSRGARSQNAETRRVTTRLGRGVLLLSMLAVTLGAFLVRGAPW